MGWNFLKYGLPHWLWFLLAVAYFKFTLHKIMFWKLENPKIFGILNKKHTKMLVLAQGWSKKHCHVKRIRIAFLSKKYIIVYSYRVTYSNSPLPLSTLSFKSKSLYSSSICPNNTLIDPLSSKSSKFSP